MHQGLTAKILICLALLLSIQANGQLSNSDEIIETIDDINVEDDTDNNPEENPNKPQYDEEFGKQQSQPKEKSAEEEKIAKPEEEAPVEEKETVERKDLKEEKGSYEEDLEKNADHNKLDKKDASPDDLENFEVDPVVQSPKEQKPKEEPTSPEDEIEAEAKAIPETPVAEEGAPVEYTPEPAGPVIVYENEKKMTREQIEELEEKTQVEIEEDPFADVQNKTNVTNYLKTYKERRPSWTYQFEISSSMYEPINYLSDINPGDDFETFYEGADVPLTGIAFEFKKNFSFAAISIGFSTAYYSAESDLSTFTLTVPSLSASLYLDTLFDEPYIVPYGTVGYSYFMYNETDDVNGVEFTGESDNIYLGVGLLLQLDWLDPSADVSAFESGIENTFVFAEARTYLDQGIMRAEGDADFSASTHVAAGVKLEF